MVSFVGLMSAMQLKNILKWNFGDWNGFGADDSVILITREQLKF